ncbi:DnaJ domain-containing protein [Chelativorans sp. ZYF759]|uniref:DnaJ C-terminal domain-containing protein n=1 Tax=Chelativorans sp. ZYF759 TaxID=2692213 RepID=UPI00145DFC3A|nr:J domain-containing protein [Chelativorans sp. ZYF759]NMG38861.1 DnaJ domain-containing protein [Chelativorans sp. ZYF759]
MRDPYEVLGVAKNASAKDIKSAYRKLAKKYHPDQNPDDPKAQERFAEATQAYDIVGDDNKRAAFDRGEIDGAGKPRFTGFEGAAGDGTYGGFRRTQRGPGGAHFEFRGAGPGDDPFADPGDIFAEIFGNAFAGKAKTGPRPGAGAASGAGRTAPPRGDVTATLDVTLEEVASAAKVTANLPNGRRIAVKLPSYVEDGQTIRLKGQGDATPLGGAGDAHVTIRFRRHPRFRVEGRDLHLGVQVPLADAVLGTKIPVETLDGKVAVTIPAWTSSDRSLRIKGKGLPLKTGGRGDLYANVRIMLPEGDAELEALMRKRRDA